MPKGNQPGSSRWARRKLADNARTVKASARMNRSASARLGNDGEMFWKDPLNVLDFDYEEFLAGR